MRQFFGARDQGERWSFTWKNKSAVAKVDRILNKSHFEHDNWRLIWSDSFAFSRN